MIFGVTNVAEPHPFKGGERQVVNVTEDGCAATLTTRYEAIGPTNIISLAHYPMTVVLYEL